MAFPPGFIHEWKRAVLANSDERVVELPAYANGASLDSLCQPSQIADFHVGTGAAIYTNVLIPAILSAKHTVVLVTCFWQSSSTLDALSAALKQLAQTRARQGITSPLRVRIGLSSRSLLQKLFHTTSRRGYIYPPSKWGELGLPDQATLAAGAIDLRVKSLFFLPFGIVHPKFLVVDNREAWMPSCNISWEEWLEGCVHFRGDAVRPLRRFYVETWEPPVAGRWSPDPESLAEETSGAADDMVESDSVLPPSTSGQSLYYADLRGAQVPTILLPSSHHQNPRFEVLPWRAGPPAPATPLNAAIMRLLELAQHDVYIQTPDFTSLPARQAVLSALERGTDVTIVTCKGMKLMEQLLTAGTTTARCIRGLLREYAKLGPQPIRRPPWWRRLFQGSRSHVRATRLPDVDVEAARPNLGRLLVFYYKPKDKEDMAFSHLKLTIVDTEYTILGSGNMDRASWFTSQELGILFHDGTMARNVRSTVGEALGGRLETAFDSAPGRSAAG